MIVFWYERRDLVCSHSKGDIFTCEDNMLFSHVKISSFRAKAHLVFHWCLHNKKFHQAINLALKQKHKADKMMANIIKMDIEISRLI